MTISMGCLLIITLLVTSVYIQKDTLYCWYLIFKFIRKESYLRYASDRLKDNDKFVLKNVKRNGHSLCYASKRLQNNKEVVLAAVKQNGDALNYASYKLRDNYEIVLAAVQQNGYALECASYRLQDIKEIVLEAVKQNGDALAYAPPCMIDDEQIVLEAIKQVIHQENNRDTETISKVLRRVLQFASDRLRKKILEQYVQNYKNSPNKNLNFSKIFNLTSTEA